MKSVLEFLFDSIYTHSLDASVFSWLLLTNAENYYINQSPDV